MNEELTTLINDLIMAALRSHWQDLPSKKCFTLACQVSLQIVTVGANSQMTMAVHSKDLGVPSLPASFPLRNDREPAPGSPPRECLHAVLTACVPYPRSLHFSNRT